MKREKEWGIFSQEEKNLTDNWQNNVLRSTYEPPKTCLFKVETEGNFCGSIVPDEPDKTEENISIHSQKIGTNITFDKPDSQIDSNGEWDF